MKKCTAILLTLLTLLITVFSALLPTILQASANTTVYTDVLDDLKQDENFSVENYPANVTDYGLYLLTIAEGSNKELFVYVYQPSYVTKPLQASSINISVTAHSQLSFNNYKLRLVSLDGMFQKYIVDGLSVPNEFSRYYQITSIFRVYDSTIDLDSEKVTENDIDEVSFSVAKEFVFEQTGVNINMQVSDVEVITITNEYAGYIRFKNDPYNLFGNSYDSFYLAFATDKQIDKLYEAEILYVSQKMERKYIQGDQTYGMITTDGNGKITPIEEPTSCKKVINSSENVEINTGGLIGTSYFFNRIQSVEAFKETIYSYSQKEDVVVSLKEEKLDNTKWVLRFVETDWEYDHTAFPIESETELYTDINSVKLLRLYFETNGVFYNLGVVAHSVNADREPSGVVQHVTNLFDDLWEKILQLVGIVFGLFIVVKIAMSLCGALLLKIVGWIWEFIKFLILIILRIVFFPLRLLFGDKKKK